MLLLALQIQIMLLFPPHSAPLFPYFNSICQFQHATQFTYLLDLLFIGCLPLLEYKLPEARNLNLVQQRVQEAERCNT